MASFIPLSTKTGTTASQTLLEIENIFILNKYRQQKHHLEHDLLEANRELSTISAAQSLPIVLKHYSKDEALRKSILAKQILNPELKMWEVNNKIKISDSFPETDFFEKLRKIGKILTNIKHQCN